MTSDEAASDTQLLMMQLLNDTASDNAASDDVASGPLVFRSTILQEQLTSGALFFQEQVAFRSVQASNFVVSFALYLLIQNQ